MRGKQEKPVKVDVKVLNQRPDIQEIRINLWISVAAAVAGASNCTSKGAPGSWADRVLEDFDAKFGVGK